MRDDERRALAEVWYEYATLRSILASLIEPPERVAQNLEPTYLVRLYARFEGLLRDRLALALEEEGTLVSCIQRLGGEDVGYDPANDGLALAWWRLFRRDRNLLAHGRSLIPALSLSATRTLMEVYLSSLKV